MAAADHRLVALAVGTDPHSLFPHIGSQQEDGVHPSRADMAKYNREWPLPTVADGRCRSSSCFWSDI